MGSILLNLSKAYDCLKDDLLLPKIQPYGFSKESIRLLLSYLTNRTQRIKISSTFSDWTNIVKGIPQTSILGPLLFNISINYLFLFSAKCEIYYFADGNSFYSCGMNLNNIFTNLIQDILKSASSVTLLGNTIDSKLNFKNHINNRKKAYYKLYALRRLRKFLTKEEAKFLQAKRSQFLYCPLIWTFCLKTDIQRAEKVQ